MLAVACRPELLLLDDPAADRWVDFDVDIGGAFWKGLQWTGPDRLALVEQGAVSLVDPATGGVRLVLGG